MTAQESAADQTGFVDVVVLNFPLLVFQQAQEHADGLMREFALIAQDRSASQGRTLPERLLAIVDELSSQYAGVGTEPELARDAALDRGERFIDLHYHVPVAVGAASQHLADIFDEADEYCRAGTHLLSLATPPEALAFRRWFLGEFVNQTSGLPPTPWNPDLGDGQDAADSGGR